MWAEEKTYRGETENPGEKETEAESACSATLGQQEVLWGQPHPYYRLILNKDKVKHVLMCFAESEP